LVQGFARYTAPQDMPQGRISSTVLTTLAMRKQLKGNKVSIIAAVVDPLNVFEYKFETKDATHVQTSANHISIRSMRLGFTNGQGTQDQVVNITDFASTWLP